MVPAILITRSLLHSDCTARQRSASLCPPSLCETLCRPRAMQLLQLPLCLLPHPRSDFGRRGSVHRGPWGDGIRRYLPCPLSPLPRLSCVVAVLCHEDSSCSTSNHGVASPSSRIQVNFTVDQIRDIMDRRANIRYSPTRFWLHEPAARSPRHVGRARPSGTCP